MLIGTNVNCIHIYIFVLKCMALFRNWTSQSDELTVYNLTWFFIAYTNFFLINYRSISLEDRYWTAYKSNNYFIAEALSCNKNMIDIYTGVFLYKDCKAPHFLFSLIILNYNICMVYHVITFGDACHDLNS